MATVKSAGSELKTQFCTKEGCYKLLQLSDYSRPIRQPNSQTNNVPVRLSFVTLKDGNECEDKVAFNIGKDMFFYNFRGVKKAPDLNHPIDRRSYKGPQPTCHDINSMTRKTDSLEMLVGFSGGQVQLMDPLKHECVKCYNEDRLIDKGFVTCIKWVPGTEAIFMASYSSGIIYVYNKEHPPALTEPQYSVIKRGNGYSIESCKNKTASNPIVRWVVGKGVINEIIFSPDCKHLALVGQDGYLRVFDYEKQELVGLMRSYFGGLLCACWSPDGKYIVTGGEDDLVSVWSFLEKRVIARGEGHKSWVNVVSFDPYTTHTDGKGFDESQEEELMKSGNNRRRTTTLRDYASDDPDRIISYRFGSAGDDTHLHLWDLSEDILRPQKSRTRSIRASTVNQNHNDVSEPTWTLANNTTKLTKVDDNTSNELLTSMLTSGSRRSSISKFSSKHQNAVSNYSPVESDELVLGSHLCPRMDNIPKLEPLVAKKISQDRMCGLSFREDCIVTATFDGYINVWARPELIKQDTSTVIH